MNEVSQTSNDEKDNGKNLAVIMWLGTVFLGFIPALCFYLLKKDNAYVVDQSKEALNWSITVMIGFLISWFLMFILIGFALEAIVILLNVIFSIMGAVATSNGRRYRVPFAIRLLS